MFMVSYSSQGGSVVGITVAFLRPVRGWASLGSAPRVPLRSTAGLRSCVASRLSGGRSCPGHWSGFRWALARRRRCGRSSLPGCRRGRTGHRRPIARLVRGLPTICRSLHWDATAWTWLASHRRIRRMTGIRLRTGGLAKSHRSGELPSTEPIGTARPTSERSSGSRRNVMRQNVKRRNAAPWDSMRASCSSAQMCGCRGRQTALWTGRSFRNCLHPIGLAVLPGNGFGARSSLHCVWLRCRLPGAAARRFVARMPREIRCSFERGSLYEARRRLCSRPFDPQPVSVTKSCVICPRGWMSGPNPRR